MLGQHSVGKHVLRFLTGVRPRACLCVDAAVLSLAYGMDRAFARLLHRTQPSCKVGAVLDPAILLHDAQSKAVAVVWINHPFKWIN